MSDNGPVRTSRRPRVAIVGATGAVGRELLHILAQRNLEIDLVKLLASERSAGEVIHFAGRALTVTPLEQAHFRDVDLAFFSAGSSVSRVHAPRAARDGALVIDNTNAFRADHDVPLVVPQVNPASLEKRPLSGLIANPNCSTIPIVRLLAPIGREFGLDQVIASTYQAASGAGLTGIAELFQSSREVIDGDRSESIANRFPVPLGFNVVPWIDSVMENGFTVEEQKMLHESRKILGLPTLKVSATCVRVPVVNCHSAAVYVRCRRPVEIDALRGLWHQAPDVVVYDPQTFPSPRLIAKSDEVHVARIRRDDLDPRAFWFWVVSDNVRVGAALNAVQIAERVIATPTFDLINSLRRHDGWCPCRSGPEVRRIVLRHAGAGPTRRTFSARSGGGYGTRGTYRLGRQCPVRFDGTAPRLPHRHRGTASSSTGNSSGP
jgi:aspartate-semialdehyde dehydrogenase